MVALFQTIVGCHRHMCPPYSALARPTPHYSIHNDESWLIKRNRWLQLPPTTTQHERFSKYLLRFCHSLHRFAADCLTGIDTSDSTYFEMLIARLLD